jgi:hypothetical protein
MQLTPGNIVHSTNLYDKKKHQYPMFKQRFKKVSFFLIFIIFIIPSCQSSEKLCFSEQSNSCRKALSDWQTSIDYIVKYNFPPDFGMYKAVVWDEEFDNAWVTKGRQINITKRFLGKLNPVQKICVAAHELAHLKMGHYYSRIGIIFANSDNKVTSDKASSIIPNYHYGTSSIDIPEGFGVNQEVEADRMALKLIKKMGLNANHYLNLLILLQGKERDPNSLISHRIEMMKKYNN